MFYVYAYLRNTNSDTAKADTPYYIGKGNGNRAYGRHKGVPVPKDKTRIIFLETNLTELGAFAIERRMIEWYGRKDLDTGILHNRTAGGEGVTGRRHTQAEKDNISKFHTGRSRPECTGERISAALSGRQGHTKRTGCVHTQETKARISAAAAGPYHSQYGTKQSDETKKKRSLALKGRTHEEIYGVDESKRLKENLRMKATQQALNRKLIIKDITHAD